MVETLLALGIDVDSKDDLGQTALHRATRCKDEEMVRLLLKNGPMSSARTTIIVRLGVGICVARTQVSCKFCWTLVLIRALADSKE